MMLTRHRVLTTGGVLIAFVGFAAAVTLIVGSLGSSGTEAQEDTSRRTVNVSGQGQVAVDPDTGLATVGVEVRESDAETALETANERIDSIIAAVKTQGVAEDDIETSGFSISPEYNWENEDRTLIGYVVNHTINIKVREIDNTGSVVGAAVDAGANVVYGISFILDDTSSAISKARELAVANARDKAEELAGLTNTTIGDVVTISEYSYTPVPAVREDAAAGIAVDEFSAPSFIPGQMTVTISVEISWELE